TEGAPAAGAAELIVDITTTGSTLHANNLKILTDGVMLRSQANLVASLNADWSETALDGARAILDRVAAEEAARNVKLVKAVVDDRTQALRSVSRVGAIQRFSESDSLNRVNVLCPRDAVADCAKLLIEEGAETVTVETLDYVFSRENPLFAPLRDKVGA
ncbi:MAG: ATP phosphoribosyltransferase, partial [Pseudomonadota bacterium]